MEIFICRGRAGARGGRGGRCHLCLDRDVFRIWNGNRRTHWNPSASSCFMTQNCFSLLPSYHHSVPPCPSLAAPAVSRRRPYLRATENLAVHVNYISGSLPRALQLSFHIKKKKGIMQKSINSLNTIYMVCCLECIQRWNLLLKCLSEVSWVT